MNCDKPRILAIDDDLTWLEQVPLILEDDCDVATASSIDQGLGAIQLNFFDVIFFQIKIC